MVCVDFIKNLIRIDSSNREGANKALGVCAEFMRSKNLRYKLLENNGYHMLVSTIGNGGKALVLNGHLDVVDARQDQFIPREVDDRLYGRGSADMKASVAAMISAMVELQNQELPCKLELQLVTDEETGGNNCSRYLADSNPHKDFVICGEPTNLGIGTLCKGILQIDIVVNGKSAHGSRPWEGENAIIKAYELFNGINKLPFALAKSDAYKGPSINLSKIEGGMMYNKVPDGCILSLDIRFLPGQDYEDIIDQIESLACEKIIIHGHADPLKTSSEDGFVQALARTIEKHSDKKANIFGQHGSSDARFFSKHGIPAVEFGPSGDNWHGNDEYIVLDSVKTFEKILIDFIRFF